MALPRLLENGRGLGLACVAALTVAQGLAAGAAAFATRGLFQAMHIGSTPSFALLSVLVGAGAVIAACRVFSRQIGERIGQDYARQIRAALFEHAALMPAPVVAARRPGYMSLRFVGDMTAFRNWLSLGLPRLIATAVLMPVMFAVLWVLDPVFALAVGPIATLGLVLIALGGLRLIPLQRRLRARRAKIAAEMTEKMPLAPSLDRLGRRERELASLDRRCASMIDAALTHRWSVEILKALPDIAAGLAAASIILFGFRAGLGTGDIAAALAAMGLMLAPLRDLGGVWNHRAAHTVAMVKATNACAHAKRDLYRNRKSLPKGPVDLAFEDLSLPSGDVLTTRIIGGTVSELSLSQVDKDRLVELLLGLDAPKTGQIRFSEIDITELSRGTLRRNVFFVDARPVILHGSLRRALLLGCDDRLDDDHLTLTALKVGLGDTLKRLGGLGGTVLEGGRNLTRDERLAVAFARLRLVKPRIIIVEHENFKEIGCQQKTWGTRRDATILCLAPKTHASRTPV
ncbi:MAG: ABC transporter ATP-binding protein [Rhodobacteraceae bacterium]|nr:ABC transporter ATP-binding protein [Paracoccaceae bacterium]